MIMNKQLQISTLGKVSQNTLGMIKRPVFESYKSPGWFE